MNRIDAIISDLQQHKQKAVSIFLTAGYPSLQATQDLIIAMAQKGVRIFEIGFPFSDPIADGPVIQKSSMQALQNGVRWQDVLQLAKNVRKKCDVALILMTYSNALYCRTWEKSVADLAAAGYDGLIVPDLIPEESQDLFTLCRLHALHPIVLAAPTSTDARLKAIAKVAGGFVYCVSVAGVTGGRSKLPKEEIQKFLRRVRQHVKVPIFLGFGISSPQQCQDFKNEADGFIIGSKMIEIIGQQLPDQKRIDQACAFVESFFKV